jgi:hypothetical protein
MVDSRYRLIRRSVAPMSGVPDIGTSNAQVTSTRLIRDKRAAPQHEGAKDQGPKRPTAPASKQGFFLIKNREKIYGGMTSFNRMAGSVLLPAHLSWSEQSCSDNFGKLAHPTKMGSTEICKKRAEEARTRAEQSVCPSEQEAWLRVASEWSKLAQTCDHPINGVMGALRRLYSGRSPQFP